MKKIALFCLLVSLLSLGLTDSSLAKRKKKKRKSKTETTKTLKPCKSKQKFFSNHLVAPENLSHIVPLGTVSPTGHTFPTRFIFFKILRENNNSHNSPAIRVPFFAPGDLTITKISSDEIIDEGTFAYTIDFTVCKELTGAIIHITSISDELQNAMDLAKSEDKFCEPKIVNGKNWERCEARIQKEIKAGTALGNAGAPTEVELDIGIYDRRNKAHYFGNAERWKNDNLPYAVCPLNYFNDEIREEYENLLGDGFSEFTENTRPSCGTVNYNVPQTAAGIWFKPGAARTHPEDEHLALVHDNINPAKAVFSVGTSTSNSNLASGLYLFDPIDSEMINRDFDEITNDGKVYCYEVLRRFANPGTTPQKILVELTSKSTLRIAGDGLGNCGNGPWSFGGQFTDFER